jgi:hypothetical protein
MVKLQLAFAVGFCYAIALYFNQSALHSLVPLAVIPLWVLIALRCASGYVLLLFLAYYLPQLRIWLAGQVRRIVESEDW